MSEARIAIAARRLNAKRDRARSLRRKRKTTFDDYSAAKSELNGRFCFGAQNAAQPNADARPREGSGVFPSRAGVKAN